MKRRILSTITALALIWSLCPTWAFAAEADPALCPHHPEHTAECEYIPPTEGQPCAHEHTNECFTRELTCVHVHDEGCYSGGPFGGEKAGEPDACAHEHTDECYTEETVCVHVHSEDCYSGGVLPDGEEAGEPDACAHEHTDECFTRELTCVHVHDEDCYSGGPFGGEKAGEPDACAHICTVESGCVTLALDCAHAHDETCGYVQADPGAPCTYVCRLCPIKELISALPDEVTEDNAEEVRARLDEILALYGELTEEEQDQLDLTRCYELQEALDAASVPEPLAGSFSLDSGSITIDSSNKPTYDGAVISGSTGTLTATGEGGGAGIGAPAPPSTTQGSFEGRTVGSIIIHGGTVNATGSNSLYYTGAGIGGGSVGYLSSIEITGGTVTATGGSYGSRKAAGIGAGDIGSASNVPNCGNITISGGTINARGGGDYAIGYGGDYTGSGSVTISVSPALQLTSGKITGYVLCTLTASIYDEDITGDMAASLEAASARWSGTAALSGEEPYCAVFTAANLWLKKGGNSITVTAGGKTWTASASISGNRATVAFGEKNYQYFTLKGIIYDEGLTGDAAVSLEAGSARWSGTAALSDEEPYCAVFTASNLILKPGSSSLALTANGKTWTDSITVSGNQATVVFGEKEYQYYTLGGTIYDINITGDMQAQVSFEGKTETVTLRKVEDYCGEFSLEKLIRPVDAENRTSAVTVMAGGNTWTGTTGTGTGKWVSIGKPVKIATFDVNASYLSQVYQGTAVANPHSGQVTCNYPYGELGFAWYQNGTLLDRNPANAGDYTLRLYLQSDPDMCQDCQRGEPAANADYEREGLPPNGNGLTK